jgi:2-dehydro-3-deoxyphosphogluconate aldolase/(4S)-4-hydroxy-2-oxoglutarate aldolase
MSHITRPPAPSSLSRTRIVAVLRAAHAREYPAVIDALVAGGVRSIELTLSTAGVFESFSELRARWDRSVELGIGTITDAEECRRAMAAGVDFVVTPTMDASIVTACVGAGVPVIPGGLTPTELHEGWRLGASAVKIFPAAAVGPSYIGQLRGPFPDIEVMPSGGVSLADIPAWLAAGASAVSLGGPLLEDAFAGGDLGALTERAHRAVALAQEAVAA